MNRVLSRRFVDGFFKFFFVAVVSVLVGSGRGAAHNILASPIHAKMAGRYERTAGPQVFEFSLFNTFLDKTVDEDALIANGGQKLRGYIFDMAMQEFSDAAPVFRNGVWTIQTTAHRNGWYWIWLQGRRVGTTEDFAIATKFKITGGEPANPLDETSTALAASVDGSKVDLSFATVDGLKFHPEKPVDLELRFSREDARASKITALDVVIVTGLGTTLVHTDRIDVTKVDSSGRIPVRISHGFPAPGRYRAWVRFVDHGERKIAPLAFVVNDPEADSFFSRLLERVRSLFTSR